MAVRNKSPLLDYLQMQRVPVISHDGHPLMPTKPSRARRWLKEGKAKIYPNDLNIFAIQLIAEPSGYETQDVVIGIDPGKLFSGVGVQSSKATLLKIHLILPFPNITKKCGFSSSSGVPLSLPRLLR